MCNGIMENCGVSFMKRIFIAKGYCTCIDCDFECETQKEIVNHCKKNKHMGEITLTKTIDYKSQEVKHYE